MAFKTLLELAESRSAAPLPVDFEEAQKELQKTAKLVAFSSEQITKLDSEVEEVRSKLAAAPIEDRAGLNEELGNKELERRNQRALLAHLRLELAGQRINSVRAAKTLERERARRDRWQEEKKRLKAEEKSLETRFGVEDGKTLADKLTELSAVEPVATPDNAVKALRSTTAGSDYRNSKDGVNEIKPAKLREVARRRLDVARIREEIARDLDIKAEEQLDRAKAKRVGIDPGATKTVEAARRAYESARRTFFSHLETTDELLDQAAAFYAEDVPELTPEHKQQLAESAATAVANKEVDYLKAEKAVLEQQALVDELKLLKAVRAAGFDEAELQAAEDALSTAKSQRETKLEKLAEVELASDPPRAMDRWQMLVPEPLWDHYRRFQEFESRLDDLAATTAGSLKTAMTDAEAALVASMVASEAAEDALEEAVQQRAFHAAVLEAAQQGFADQVTGAFRGESHLPADRTQLESDFAKETEEGGGG